LHRGTNGPINDYLDADDHGLDETGAPFWHVRNNRTGRLEMGSPPSTAAAAAWPRCGASSVDADGRCTDLVLMAGVDGMAARMLR
jgi:hypothetical protein